MDSLYNRSCGLQKKVEEYAQVLDHHTTLFNRERIEQPATVLEIDKNSLDQEVESTMQPFILALQKRIKYFPYAVDSSKSFGFASFSIDGMCPRTLSHNLSDDGQRLVNRFVASLDVGFQHVQSLSVSSFNNNRAPYVNIDAALRDLVYQSSDQNISL